MSLFAHCALILRRVVSGRLALLRVGCFSLSLAAMTFAAPSLALDGSRAELVEGSAGERVYGSNHLADLQGSGELVYDYTLEGDILEEPFKDEVRLKFEESDAEDGFDFDIAVFPKTRTLSVSTTAETINPLLLVFFQRDADFMSRNTGGSPQFFRSRLRDMLAQPAQAEEGTAEVADNEIAVETVSLMPYDDADAASRMPDFAKKLYQISLSPDLPGSVYELSSEVPAMDGSGVRLRETYRFRELVQ